MKKMKLSRLIGFPSICIMFVIPMLARGESSSVLLSQDIALAHAQKFCSKIAQPAKVNANVEALLDPVAVAALTPMPEANAAFPQPMLPRTYWQPCWHFSFQDGVRISVAANTGIISKYQNLGLMNRLAADKTPAEQPLSQQQAISLATAAIKATGQHEELTFSRADLWSADKPLNGDHEWVVRWERTLHGIPYHDQHASVLLQATTGTVEEVVLMYSLSPYTGDTKNFAVDQSAATRIATGYCAASSVSLPFESAHLEIVQPNTLLTGIKQSPDPDDSSHLAWVCRYTKEGDTVDIWVDAQTGVLLGGESAQPKSLQLPRKLQKNLLLR